MTYPIATAILQFERDVMLARQRARQIASLLGFDGQEQTRIATAVSEIARNAFEYGGKGKVEFLLEGRTAPQVFVIRISDNGPGIPNLAGILEGEYRSRTGMGLGIVGARRLMDQFHIHSTPGQGTIVALRKIMKAGAPPWDAPRLAELSRELGRQPSEDPFQELQRQNQELLQTLDELRQRQQELLLLNRELEDTNRGVVALYAELDEKADHLRRADELKSRFLSNMSHEFRTPLNSILALSRLMLDRTDGDLTSEQEKQVGYIRKAATELLELVNDLLDLAKIEAGKTVVRPSEFEISTLFSALRGMLRPLLVNESVRLVFEEPDDLPALFTDEAKVSQILRNLISNALKFTERGEVRVSAALAGGGREVLFTVADTGIGIAADDQTRIFTEFSQLDHPIQKKIKGTGLGLPLTKRLTELLGGRISLQSELRVGSAFRVTIPALYIEPASSAVAEVIPALDDARVPVLLVEDDPADVLLYQKYLKASPYQLVPVRTLREARRAIPQVRPRAILLDVVLKGEDTWSFLAELKRDGATRAIPVMVVSSVEDEHKGFGLGAEAYHVKPVNRTWLLGELQRCTAGSPARRVLIVDDEEVSRYVLKGLLAQTSFQVIEATGGLDGLRRAREETPDVILLDLVMPDLSGWEVLQALRRERATEHIRVIVVTSLLLEEPQRRILETQGVALLGKEGLSSERLLASMRGAGGGGRIAAGR